MRTFEFKSEWFTDIKLEKLSTINYSSFSPKKDNNSLVRILIIDERDYNPYPTTEQIFAIEYIMNNQDEIYYSIYKALKNIIYPIDSCNSEDEVPSLNSINDMNKIIGLNGIFIDIHSNAGMAWTNYYFDYHFDTEHGLNMVFQGNKFLDFGQIGGLTYENIMSKEDFNTYVERLNVRHSLQIHKPNPITNKLKPWQINENEYFPFGLIHANRIEDLIEYLKNYPEQKIKKLDRLIEIAQLNQKYEFEKELLKLR